MGGGNQIQHSIQAAQEGLSPRGRGKPHHRDGQWDYRRSIPAWAGETRSSTTWTRPTAVYPRVGGGNENLPEEWNGRLGLSPRGRGKLMRILQAMLLIGSIPAWAGETFERLSAMSGSEVYPRVGGGNQDRPHHRQLLAGLSPRGRGKRRPKSIVGIGIRSIPAWAGETPPRPQSR